MKKRKIEITNFWEDIAKDINSPRKIREFLNAANKAYDETKDIYVLLSALKLVAVAKGNMSSLARESKISRKSIYNFFRKGSNPTVENLVVVSQKLGINLHLDFAQVH